MFVEREHGNTHDCHAVCLLKGGSIVGHVPREVAKYFWFFLDHGGTITCEVTGSRKHGKGLEVPCTYTFVAKEKNIMKLKELLQKKSTIKNVAKLVYHRVWLIRACGILKTSMMRCQYGVYMFNH